MVKTCPPASDMSSHLGGEEFAIILPNTAVQGALAAAEKTRQKVEAMEIPYGHNTIRLTSSFGVASQDDDINTDSLLKNADKVLYKVKKRRQEPCLSHRYALWRTLRY